MYRLLYLPCPVIDWTRIQTLEHKPRLLALRIGTVQCLSPCACLQHEGNRRQVPVIALLRLVYVTACHEDGGTMFVPICPTTRPYIPVYQHHQYESLQDTDTTLLSPEYEYFLKCTIWHSGISLPKFRRHLLSAFSR
jgi:hypothetical protein